MTKASLALTSMRLYNTCNLHVINIIIICQKMTINDISLHMTSEAWRWISRISICIIINPQLYSELSTAACWACLARPFLVQTKSCQQTPLFITHKRQARHYNPSFSSLARAFQRRSGGPTSFKTCLPWKPRNLLAFSKRWLSAPVYDG